MKLLKGYYAYLAIAGGFLLCLAAKDNWKSEAKRS